LANLIDRYARDRRAKISKPIRSVTVAVDGMINPKLLTTGPVPLLVSDPALLADAWRDLLAPPAGPE
jgi:hypothetical protein